MPALALCWAANGGHNGHQSQLQREEGTSQIKSSLDHPYPANNLVPGLLVPCQAG